MIIHSNGEEIAFNQFGSFKGVSRWDIYEKKKFSLHSSEESCDLILSEYLTSYLV